MPYPVTIAATVKVLFGQQIRSLKLEPSSLRAAADIGGKTERLILYLVLNVWQRSNGVLPAKTFT
jgi:hypothetical protein